MNGIRDVSGVSVLSLHYDVSTVTGEEVILFTPAEPPLYRQVKNRKGGNEGRSRARKVVLKYTTGLTEGCEQEPGQDNHWPNDHLFSAVHQCNSPLAEMYPLLWPSLSTMKTS